MHPKTREEMDALERYGGEILFTPGDIVLSSSAIIETTPPNLAMEKLLALMQVGRASLSTTCATALTKLQGRQGPRRRRHHRRFLHLLHAHRRHHQDADVQREASSGRWISSAAPASWPSTCERPARRCVFSTVLGDDALKDFVLKDLRSQRHRVPRGHRSARARRRRRTSSSPTATGCSRWTSSTIARSPNRSSMHFKRELAGQQGRTSSSSAISGTAFSTSVTIPQLTAAVPAGAAARGRQPGRQPLGQHPRVPGFRSDHAERTRGPLRPGRSGFDDPPAGARALQAGRLQAAHPEAGRTRHDHLSRSQLRSALVLHGR